MNDNEKNAELGFKVERGFHYVVMVFISMLVIVSIVMVFIVVRGQNERPEAHHGISENGGETKPLPDFIVDTVPSDELEMLKP